MDRPTRSSRNQNPVYNFKSTLDFLAASSQKESKDVPQSPVVRRRGRPRKCKSGEDETTTVRLTEGRKSFILEGLTRDMKSNSKIKDVGSTNAIQKLAEEMADDEVTSKEIRNWLGITDNLDGDTFHSKEKVEEMTPQTEAPSTNDDRMQKMEEELKRLQEKLREIQDKSLREELVSTEEIMEVESGIESLQAANEEMMTPKLSIPIEDELAVLVQSIPILDGVAEEMMETEMLNNEDQKNVHVDKECAKELWSEFLSFNSSQEIENAQDVTLECDTESEGTVKEFVSNANLEARNAEMELQEQRQSEDCRESETPSAISTSFLNCPAADLEMNNDSLISLLVNAETETFNNGKSTENENAILHPKSEPANNQPVNVEGEAVLQPSIFSADNLVQKPTEKKKRRRIVFVIPQIEDYYENLEKSEKIKKRKTCLEPEIAEENL